MKKAIIFQNCENFNIIKEHEKYADNIFVDTNSEDKILKKYNLDYFLQLFEKEEIVLCKNFDNNTRTFVSDGNWMILENRIYPETKRNGSPCVIKANKYLETPFIKIKNLKFLFKNKEYDKFVVECEKYIFENLNYDDPYLEYYMAMTFFFKLNKPEKAQLYLARFINKYKNFSEGWCLLGDFLVHQKRNIEAIKAYENAMEYGSKRNVYDGMPICLKKYTTYPNEMIQKITDVLANTSVISVDNL
jgi:tetratricopeptide (TPR) repeat protein